MDTSIVPNKKAQMKIWAFLEINLFYKLISKRQWSRGDLNPCLQTTKIKPLHAYLDVRFSGFQNYYEQKFYQPNQPIFSSLGKLHT